MSIVEVQVPLSFGRVARLTESKSHSWVTLECFDISRAYRFPVPVETQVSVGDWMTVSGTIQVERISGSEATGSEVLRMPTYYHVPHGLSSKDGWVFAEISDPVWEIIGQDYVNKTARDIRDVFPKLGAELAVSGHIDPATIDETIVVAQKLIHSLRAYRETKSPGDLPPLKAVDLEIETEVKT